jgi:hypothetical protein
MQELTQEDLKGLQSKSLEMAKYFKAFCEKHDLTFYFCGGCCIGAVRTGGFIPWDDDVDVFMPRESYERLRELWPEYADSRYQLVESDETFIDHDIFVAIRDAQTTFIKPYQRLTKVQVNRIVAIDERDVWRASSQGAAIPRVAQTAILFMNHTNSRIYIGPAIAGQRRPVGRTVIDKHYFDLADSLSEQRIEAAGQILLRIVHRHNNRNFRLCCIALNHPAHLALVV